MLNSLRAASRSWIALAFIGLLIASFAVWGVNDIFRGGPANAVATVGKERITTVEFANEFRREIRRLEQQTGQSFTQEEARAYGVHQALFQRLTQTAAIDALSSELGLFASDAMIARELGSYEAFRDQLTGRFDRRAYESVLAREGLTRSEFEATIAEDLARRQLFAVATVEVSAPRILAEQRLRFVGETRRVALVTIPAVAAPEPDEPTPEQLREFYDDNLAAYTAPERRAISVFRVETADMLPDISISEDELSQYYEARRDQLVEPERRDVLELTATDEEAAAQAAMRLRDGDDPDAIATELGLPAPNIYSAAVAAEFIDATVSAAAFSLEEGVISDPVEGRLAWSVLRVDAITSAREATFESARVDLMEELARESAEAQLFEVARAFNNGLDVGMSLDEAVREAGGVLYSYGPLDSNGVDERGVRVDILAERPDILAAAFSHSLGYESNLEELNDGFFAFAIDEVVPASARPFETVADDVAERWRARQRVQALRDLGETARQALEDGETPAAAGEAASPDAEVRVLRASRARPVEGLDTGVLRTIFAGATGDATLVPLADGAIVAVRIEEIEPAAEWEDVDVEAARLAVSAELDSDLEALFVQGLMSRYPVSTYPAEIDRATGVSTQ